MRRILLSVLAAALFIPAFAMPAAAVDAKSQLIAAAAEAHISLHTEELVVLVHGENTFAVAPIRGFENIGATAFAGGVDMAYAYIDFPGSSIPTGNYTLRGRAPESSIQLGDYDGTIELVNADGGIVATFPAKMSTFSTTVPDPLPYPRPIITGAWKTAEEVEGSSAQATAEAKAAPAHSSHLRGLPVRTPGDRLFLRDSKGWLVYYVFVRIVCPNGEVIEGFVRVW
jgi:hypothetical protein